MAQNVTTAMITGASTGIGAVYADRLAKRGHNLVLVARNGGRLDQLAARLRAETGVSVDVLVADLTNSGDLTRVERRLQEDAAINLLINNAGSTLAGSFAEQDVDQVDWLLRLNVTAVTRLAHAVAGRFIAQDSGAIVNVSSVLALVPEFGSGIYGATKSYVLSFSQGLQSQYADTGIYVQAVLPAATRTEIWDHAGADINEIPGVMEVGDLVDAALVGFDRKEAITIPSLPVVDVWDNLEAVRQAMGPQFMNGQPAQRYRL